MDIICTCTACNARFKVGEAAAGKRARCPKCQAVVSVPAASAAAPAVDPLMPPTRSTTPAPTAATQPEEPAPFAFAPIITTTPKAETSKTEPARPKPAAKTTKANPSKAKPTEKKEGEPGKSKLTPMFWIVTGCGSLALLILVSSLFYMMSGSGDARKPKVAKKPAKKPLDKAPDPAMVVLDWPESERADALLKVDGKPQAFATNGPVEFEIRQGKHVVEITRRNFEVQRLEFNVKGGKTASLKPKWIATGTAPTTVATTEIAANPPVNTDTPGSSADVEMPEAAAPATTASTLPDPVVTAAASTGTSRVEGFQTWFDDMNEARHQARSAGKSILMVIGSSDGSPATGRLAAALHKAGLPEGELAARFVPVVVDIPITQEGQERLIDERQSVILGLQYLNAGEARSYQGLLGQLPLLVLADDDARPYAVIREWDDGVANVVERIDASQVKRTERDKWFMGILEAADAPARAAAAAGAAQWTLDEKLVVQYYRDITEWHGLVEEVDPKNELGQLETALEAQLYSQLMQPQNIENPVQLARQFDVLDPFLTDLKFVNKERGAKLHTLAYNVLTELSDNAQAQRHLSRARMYDPESTDLPSFDSNVLSFGTGFVIADGGYLLTNNHVVEGPGKLAVRVAGQEDPLPAKLIHSTKSPDLALIKVDFPADMQPQPLSLSDSKVRQAMKVAAFGYPRSDVVGEDMKAVEGIVSSLPNKRSQNMLVLDIRINPGNSGGPLCDARGNVIGMVTAKTNLDGGDNFGMAIPTAQLEVFLKDCLPAEATLPKAPKAGANAKALEDVTEVIGPAVLMVLKMK